MYPKNRALRRSLGTGIPRTDDSDDTHNTVRPPTTQQSVDRDDDTLREQRPQQPYIPHAPTGLKAVKRRQGVGQRGALSPDRGGATEGQAPSTHDYAGDKGRYTPVGDHDDPGLVAGPSQGFGQTKKFKFKKTYIGDNPAIVDEAGPNAGQPAASRPKTGAGGDSDEQFGAAGDQASLSDRRAERNKGMKKGYKTGSTSQEDSIEDVDLGAMPDIIYSPAKQYTGSDATGSVAVVASDGFHDEDDALLTRIQRRVNAVRKGGRKIPVQISEDDPDLEVVDTNMIASLNMIKKRRKTVKLNDEEEQKNIAVALEIKAKWPKYVAAGLTVAFVLGDIVLIVLRVTDEFHLINIPSLELIEGVVELVKTAFETVEEAAEAKRNGRGESKEVMAERKKAGLAALKELTGVERLTAQQEATYDRLRVLLALEQKEENARQGPE